MKKTTLGLAVLLLILLVSFLGACGEATSADGTTTTAGASGGAVTTSGDTSASGNGQSLASSSTDTTETTVTDDGSAKSDKVFKPSELLSAEEATALVGQPVTLEDGSLFEDQATGVISERYAYDLSGTGIHALVEIHQDGLKTSDGSVRDAFLFEKDLSKSEITSVDGLGDDAFTHGQGQLHLLYGSYYIVVAFDADPYETDKNGPLNIKIGTKMLENLKAKLG